MAYHYSKAYSRYGANMGRCDELAEAEKVKKVHLEQVRLDSGGYDPGGAYWGHGGRLYVAYDTEYQQEVFIRAMGRNDAKEQARGFFPNATFYR